MLNKSNVSITAHVKIQHMKNMHEAEKSVLFSPKMNCRFLFMCFASSSFSQIGVNYFKTWDIYLFFKWPPQKNLATSYKKVDFFFLRVGRRDRDTARPPASVYSLSDSQMNTHCAHAHGFTHTHTALTGRHEKNKNTPKKWIPLVKV